MSDDSNQGSTGGKSPDKGRRLRRPLPSTQEKLRKGEFDMERDDSPVMKSRLSADAPEFVPKYTQQYQNDSDPQNMLYQDFQRLVSIRPSHLNATAVPPGSKGSENPAEVFKEAVFTLTSNPGPTEEYVKRVIDLLNLGESDEAVIDDIINTLFEQSVREPNFRFTGAKVCKLLSNGLKSHPKFSSFRGMYLKRCKLEFDKRQQLLETNIERLCGLSMYFGELFLVLEIESNGVLTKIGVLRDAIADLLRTLLSKLDDETVNCAMKLLKLTGTALMETRDLQGSFDDIFGTVRSLEKHSMLNKTSHCLVNSVLSRLEYNFGAGEQSSPPKPQQSLQASVNSSFTNEPTFYNVQGQPISREEAGFYGDDSDFVGLNSEEQEAYLQWEAENLISQQQWSDADQGSDVPWSTADQAGDGQWTEAWSTGMSDYEQWSGDQDQVYGYDEGDYYADYSSEMDDEMAAAYEMFLKESGQTRH